MHASDRAEITVKPEIREASRRMQMSWPTSALKASDTGEASRLSSGFDSPREVDVENLVYKPIVRRAVRHVLVDRNRSLRQPQRGRFNTFEVGRLFADAWYAHRERSPEESPAPASGNGFDLKITCLTVAFLDVLVSAGVERGYAIKLVAEMTQIVRENWLTFMGPPPRQRPDSSCGEHPEGHVSLPVAFIGPGGYRQVGSEQWNRMRRRAASGR
jgi:hypothetical protein